MAGSKAIAFFDFDGTLTSRDTLAELLKWWKGRPAYYRGLLALAPVLAAYKLGVMSNHRAKEKLLAHFLGGMKEADFDAVCAGFVAERLPALLRPSALDTLGRHRQEGAEIVIVSASPVNWVGPWCRQQDFSCLATRLQVAAGRLTGRIEGANCHGEEKVRRIRSQYALQVYRRIYAYGDTAGDLPMLSLATDSFYKPFRGETTKSGLPK